MKRTIVIVLAFLPFYLMGQSNLKISSSIKTQSNLLVYPNKGYGAGVGIEIDAKFQSKFKPYVGFNWDCFPAAAVLTTFEGERVPDMRCISSVFIGLAYQPFNRFWFSLEGGPSFVPSHTYLSLKPTIGYYFDQKQRLGIDISLTNIFHADIINDSSYGYMSLGLMIKLF
jgi:hypothetical protein